jgi:hypothetical protein
VRLDEKEKIMNRKSVLLVIVLGVVLAGVAATALAAGQSDVAQVRRSTAQYHRAEAAQAAGWDLVEGLDHCFDNPGVGAMGYHYINVELLDTELDALQPEAMVYAPGPNGQLQLGAVEYIVPVDAWTETGNEELPSVLGHTLHLNQPLNVYVLHLWLFKNNPAGMFEDWNPNVSCP